ncbi:GDP-fucose transporter nac [Lycorma delicatula]|uniref:GDP-fucose transporter nac n=1 Tax=Lycorma delicatula TaxID=130591 RepID=UPI003F50D8DC
MMLTERILLGRYIHIASVVVIYWIVSIVTVFINKTLLSINKVDAPFFIFWYQCFISALICLTLKLLSKCFPSRISFPEGQPFSKNVMKKVVPLSFLFTCMVGFNNLCLKHVGVPFYYVGRSLTTVFNVILTYVILKKNTSLECIAYCGVIVSGFWLGVYQENDSGSFSALGTFFGVMGSLSLAFYSIHTKTVLPAVNNHIWLLSYYNNVYACIFFIPMMIFNGEIKTLIEYEDILTFNFWSLMTVGGICGFSIGYVTSLQIKVTSPLTHNISGTAKACAQTVIATYWYQEQKPWLWWVSNWIVLAGSAGYTSAKQKEMQENFLKQLHKSSNV